MGERASVFIDKHETAAMIIAALALAAGMIAVGHVVDGFAPNQSAGIDTPADTEAGMPEVLATPPAQIAG